MNKGRHLVWFSCGIASAAVAKLSAEKYPESEILYCDTLAYEHPDNKRFMREAEEWIGKKITILKSDKYTDIYDVFEKTRYLVGPFGARCTTELKKIPRKKYQNVDDTHLFGFTADEMNRVERFHKENPELIAEFPLIEHGLTKQDCLDMVSGAGIEIPMMYKLGYNNNNCIGCVKGGAGYWNKIRVDFPEVFEKMSKVERDIGISILRKKGERLFLDELPPTMGRYKPEYDMGCGVLCSNDVVDQDVEFVE